MTRSSHRVGRGKRCLHSLGESRRQQSYAVNNRPESSDLTTGHSAGVSGDKSSACVKPLAAEYTIICSRRGWLGRREMI